LTRPPIHAGFDDAKADMLRKVGSKNNSEKKLRDFHESFKRASE
jgi:hypothetical protein